MNAKNEKLSLLLLLDYKNVYVSVNTSVKNE